jgi:transcriptional regulator with XRE-family HTH domain
MESIGDRVRKRRESLRLTQEKLAELSGVAQGTISRIEKGDTTSPDHKTERALARALNTTIEELRGESGQNAGDQTSPPTKDPMPPAPNEVDSPLESAIGRAFDSNRHSLRDTDAVRAAFRDTAQLQLADGHLMEAVTRWLDAAARLRQRGSRVTTESLLVEFTREQLSRGEQTERGTNTEKSPKVAPRKPSK